MKRIFLLFSIFSFFFQPTTQTKDYQKTDVFLIFATVDGCCYLVDRFTSKIVWYQCNVFDGPLLFINSIISAKKTESSSLEVFKKDKNQEILGYTFFYLFEPLGDGTVYIVSEDSKLLKVRKKGKTRFLI